MAVHVISLAIERLYVLLSHSAALRFPVGVRDDAIALGAELKQIRKSLAFKPFGLLEDPDEEKERLEKSLTELAYQVCDAVDHCAFKNKALSQIKSIRAKIKAIPKMTPAVTPEAGLKDVQRRDRSDATVGLSGAASWLRSKLTEETGDDGLSCVSIVGLGGIGKTTLARHVFHDQELAQHFERRAWVCVSPNFSVRDVLYEMLVQVGFQGEYRKGKKTDGPHRGEVPERGIKKERDVLKEWGEGALIELIYRELECRRYLVVVDDIWDWDIWDKLKCALPNRETGSKILFTTGLSKVPRCVGGFVFHHERLSHGDSVELMALKVFGHGQSCPSEYDEALKEVARLCKGFPLMVILLGGLLRTKSSLDGWNEVISQLVKSNDDIIQLYWILLLCYNDLPWYLTPCFLYLSSFSANSEIPKQKLIRMWVAEGFIPRPRREVCETIESVAEGYLQALVDRCLVEIVKTDHTGAGIKSCRVHDIVQKLSLQVAKEINFSVNMPPPFLHFVSDNTRMLRVVIHDDYDLEEIQVGHPRTISLIWLAAATNPLPLLNSWSRIMKNFRLLRLLEIGFFSRSYSSEPTKLPRAIGNLVNLRYLGLRGALICKLPSSVGNLLYLQTLDLRGNDFQTLPKTISKLTRLRHLLLPSVQSYTPSSPNWDRSLFRMDMLKNLHTLKLIEAKALIKCDAVVRLTNIRRLKVEFRSCQEVRAVLASPIVERSRLQSLHMSLLSKEAFPSLESLSRCHNLAKLGLHGRLNEDDLQWLPETLQKVMFSDSKMKRDPMAVLEKMSHLKFLRLGKNSYRGAEMVCSRDGFPELKTLQLVGLSKLRAWRVERGSMLSLATVDLENTHINLPEYLKLISSLRVLNITDLRENGQVPTETTSQSDSEDEGIAGEENLNRANRITQSASFAWNLSDIRPGISVNLINAQIISAVN